jgi:DNA topoisomerase-6 subunit B
MLTTSLSRMSNKRVDELEEITGIDFNKRPKDMKWEEAEKIVELFQSMDFMAPPTAGLIPIGEDQVEKGIREILDPEYVKTITRKPKTYKGGVSFVIESGISYGGKSGRVVGEQKKAEIMRFANRVPLTFDQGSCGITEALKSIDWKRYGIRDLENAPITVFVNIVSTHVPYMSTGKQSVAPEAEIMQEVRQATMKIARSLQKYLNAKRAAKEEAMRSKIFETFVPVILREAALLAEEDVPEYGEVLNKVTRKPPKILGDVINAE